jgi:hypothetical protein
MMVRAAEVPVGHGVDTTVRCRGEEIATQARCELLRVRVLDDG